MSMRGISRFSIEILLSQSAEKLRRRTLLCFEKFLASKNVSANRGGSQDFPSRTFCLTVPNIFVGEPLSVSVFAGIETLFACEGNITIFYTTFVVSESRKVS